jgi:hypothetical protein
LGVKALALFLAMAMTSCEHGPPSGASAERARAEKLMATIRPGMTLAEIERTVPHTKVEELGLREHGGEYFELTVSERYFIQIRVAHPKPGFTVERSVINYSPGLWDRRTKRYVSGDNKPW